MSIIFADQIEKNQSLTVKPKEGFCFQISSLALDPESERAHLYLLHAGKQILIQQLNRTTPTPILSSSLSLEFSPSQKLKFKSKKGKVHLIGFYKQLSNSRTKEKINIVEEESSEKNQPESPPQQQLRRSTRITKPANATQSTVKERQALKNMANLFELEAKDLDEDEDDESFSNKNGEEDDEEEEGEKYIDEEQQEFGVKKKVKKQEKEEEVFPRPTKNPYN